jgi:hypothetical protein
VQAAIFFGAQLALLGVADREGVCHLIQLSLFLLTDRGGVSLTLTHSTRGLDILHLLGVFDSYSAHSVKEGWCENSPKRVLPKASYVYDSSVMWGTQKTKTDVVFVRQ